MSAWPPTIRKAIIFALAMALFQQYCTTTATATTTAFGVLIRRDFQTYRRRPVEKRLNPNHCHGSGGWRTFPCRSRVLLSTRATDENQSDLDSAMSTTDHPYFDPHIWELYESTVRAVMESGRVIRKERLEDLEPVMEYLCTPTPILPLPSLAWTSNDNNDTTTTTDQQQVRGDFRLTMKLQRDEFLKATNLTMSHHEFAVRTLTYMGDFCAKRQTPEPLMVAWHKLKEAGMTPRENCISTYLYVLSLTERATDAASEVATFHDLLYEPNEKTITLRIKSMIIKGDAAGAEQLLGSLPVDATTGDWQRLRTYLPVLNLYCVKGDMTSALRMYRQMRESPGVLFEPDTYALLIGALAERGYFRGDSPPIPDAEKYGFSSSCGPRLLDLLVAEMADDILEINSASAQVLYQAFAKNHDDAVQPGDAGSTVEEKVPMDNSPASANDLIVSRVTVDGTTAICPRSGTQLRLFRLEEHHRRHVHDTLLKMAAMQYEEFMEKLEARYKDKMQDLEGSDFAVRELSRFSQWLSEREGEPFTAIVDGPNVAYFGHGNVHYSQVQLIVEQLERMNERPVVIMPQKYVAPKFHVNVGFVQELNDQELDIMNGLLDAGKMYTVPAKCLDDYYWMLASVANQTAAAQDEIGMYVSTNDKSGRFPGLRPMLITNDQMRDHKLELLEPRLFRRWCSCHIVNYNFTDFEETEWEDRKVDFFPADFFSREIQGNPYPGTDANSSSLVWHFPVSEWDEHDRLCIRVPV